jgi:hypothetical protein
MTLYIIVTCMWVPVSVFKLSSPNLSPSPTPVPLFPFLTIIFATVIVRNKIKELCVFRYLEGKELKPNRISFLLCLTKPNLVVFTLFSVPVFVSCLATPGNLGGGMGAGAGIAIVLVGMAITFSIDIPFRTAGHIRKTAVQLR